MAATMIGGTAYVARKAAQQAPAAAAPPTDPQPVAAAPAEVSVDDKMDQLTKLKQLSIWTHSHRKSSTPRRPASSRACSGTRLNGADTSLMRCSSTGAVAGGGDPGERPLNRGGRGRGRVSRALIGLRVGMRGWAPKSELWQALIATCSMRCSMSRMPSRGRRRGDCADRASLDSPLSLRDRRVGWPASP
jgi:hypothetical protein